MGRLIDEDAVKRRMHETMDYKDLYLPVHFEMCMDDAPTIDAVQVVRCKDCKHGEYREDYDDYECRESGCGLVHSGEWYCADGEPIEPPKGVG